MVVNMNVMYCGREDAKPFGAVVGSWVLGVETDAGRAALVAAVMVADCEAVVLR